MKINCWFIVDLLLIYCWFIVYSWQKYMADIWEKMADIWEFHSNWTFGHMGKYGGHMGKNGQPIYDLGHMGISLELNSGKIMADIQCESSISVHGRHHFWAP
jgi:hypothetical protein